MHFLSVSQSHFHSCMHPPLQDGRRLKSRLVVAADGAQSRVRQMAGFRTIGWSYNQRAVVATVQIEGEQGWPKLYECPVDIAYASAKPPYLLAHTGHP
jgi:2-polyprenyl-6-methoxyphenol hydroxylase-like FAD-dependent oxidoreductase